MLRVSRLLILAATLLVMVGCSTPRHGSRSTWALLTQGRQSSWQQLGRTARHLEGHSGWSDVAETSRMLTDHGSGGFGAIARDLGHIFSPILSVKELAETFRLLR